MLKYLRQIMRLRLLATPKYWRLKRVRETIAFQRVRLAFNSLSRISAMVSFVSALLELLKTSWKSTVPGTVVAAALAIASGFSPELMPNAILLPFSRIAPGSAAAHDTLLAVVLTVTGLFLTLYYTNFNTVIGRLYAEYPESVRILLINEPQNRAALMALTNFIVFTVVTLGFGAGFGVRLNISLFLVVVGGALTVPIFAFIARRTLFFFDPTYLANAAIEELATVASEVTANRRFASHAAVQDLKAKVAANALNKLHALSRIAAEKNNFRRDSLCALLIAVFSFLPEYQRWKRSIPTTSKWYRESVRHRHWYMADIANLQVALHSGVGLIPGTDQDRDWLEKSIVDMLERCFERAVIEQDWPVAYRILEASLLLIEALGAGYQLQIASKSFRSLYLIVEKHAAGPTMC